MMIGHQIQFNMKNYEIHIEIDGIYDIVENIKAPKIHLALSICREKIKREIKPQSIWFHEIKIKNEII